MIGFIHKGPQRFQRPPHRHVDEHILAKGPERCRIIAVPHQPPDKTITGFCKRINPVKPVGKISHRGRIKGCA